MANYFKGDDLRSYFHSFGRAFTAAGQNFLDQAPLKSGHTVSTADVRAEAVPYIDANFKLEQAFNGVSSGTCILTGDVGSRTIIPELSGILKFYDGVELSEMAATNGETFQLIDGVVIKGLMDPTDQYDSTGKKTADGYTIRVLKEDGTPIPMSKGWVVDPVNGAVTFEKGKTPADQPENGKYGAIKIQAFAYIGKYADDILSGYTGVAGISGAISGITDVILSGFNAATTVKGEITRVEGLINAVQSEALGITSGMGIEFASITGDLDKTYTKISVKESTLSEEFFFVNDSGVGVSGIQDAIDEAVGDIVFPSAGSGLISGTNAYHVGKGAGITVGEDTVSVNVDDATIKIVGDQLSSTLTLSGLGGNDDYAARYQLQDGTGRRIGDIINIPKDQFLKDADFIPSASETDVEEYGEKYGFTLGEPLIHFTFAIALNDEATGETTESDKHMYLPVSDLVDTYTAGSGIIINDNNAVSVKAGNGVTFDLSGGVTLKKTAGSESFFFVDAVSGVGVSGIQDAIDEAIEEATSGKVDKTALSSLTIVGYSDGEEREYTDFTYDTTTEKLINIGNGLAFTNTIEEIPNQILSVRTGYGITFDSSSGVTVDAGPGISVNTNGVSVKKSSDSESFFFVDAVSGVGVSGIQKAINDAVGSIKIPSAGLGLTYDDTNTYHVGAGNGITVGEDTVSVNAGPGISVNTNGVSVKKSSDSESFFFVDAVSGVGVSGIQDAIDEAIEEATSGKVDKTALESLTIIWKNSEGTSSDNLSLVYTPSAATKFTFGNGFEGIAMDDDHTKLTDISVKNGTAISVDASGVSVIASSGITLSGGAVEVKTGNGITFDSTSGVTLKKAADSESFFFVNSTGVGVSGIQDAIDEASGYITGWVNDNYATKDELADEETARKNSDDYISGVVSGITDVILSGFSATNTVSSEIKAIKDLIGGGEGDSITDKINGLSGVLNGYTEVASVSSAISGEAAARAAADTYISGTLLKGFDSSKTVTGEITRVEGLINAVQSEALGITSGMGIEFASITGDLDKTYTKISVNAGHGITFDLASGVTVDAGNGIKVDVNGVSVNVDNKTIGFDANGLVSSLITLSGLGGDSNYAARYQLQDSDGNPIGATINIPKDQFLSGASYDANDKELQFTFAINEKNNDGSLTSIPHIVTVPVGDLVDTYTEGNGISIDSENNVVSIEKSTAPYSESFFFVNDTGAGVSGIQTAINTATSGKVDKTALSSLIIHGYKRLGEDAQETDDFSITYSPTQNKEFYFGNGLKFSLEGETGDYAGDAIVSIHKSPSSESFFFVDETGVGVSGINEAIADVNATINTELENVVKAEWESDANKILDSGTAADQALYESFESGAEWSNTGFILTIEPSTKKSTPLYTVAGGLEFSLNRSVGESMEGNDGPILSATYRPMIDGVETAGNPPVLASEQGVIAYVGEYVKEYVEAVLTWQTIE